MDWSEVDQEVAGSAADARAERARRSAQPSNKEGLEDPALEPPLKDTGIPPSPPSPPIDGRPLSDWEAWTRWLKNMDRVAQLEALEEFRKRKGESGGVRGEGASDKRPMPDVKAKQDEYMKQYRARPEVKAKRAEYEARPEVKARRAEYLKRPEV